LSRRGCTESRASPGAAAKGACRYFREDARVTGRHFSHAQRRAAAVIHRPVVAATPLRAHSRRFAARSVIASPRPAVDGPTPSRMARHWGRHSDNRSHPSLLAMDRDIDAAGYRAANTAPPIELLHQRVAICAFRYSDRLGNRNFPGGSSDSWISNDRRSRVARAAQPIDQLSSCGDCLPHRDELELGPAHRAASDLARSLVTSTDSGGRLCQKLRPNPGGPCCRRDHNRGRARVCRPSKSRSPLHKKRDRAIRGFASRRSGPACGRRISSARGRLHSAQGVSSSVVNTELSRRAHLGIHVVRRRARTMQFH
jgi:hypothetical protein